MKQFLNTLNQIYKNSDNSGYYPSWVSNINSALTQINNGKDSNGNTIEAGKDTTKYKDKLNCSPQLNAFSGCTAVKPRELDDIKAEYAKNNKIDSNANFSKYWNSLDNAEVLFNSGDDHWHEETTIKELCNLANLLSALIFGYGNALEGSILDIVGVTSGRTLNFSTLGSQLGYSDNFGTGHLSEIELHTNLVPGENIGAQVANGTESINVMDPGYHEFINNLTKLNSENPNSAKSLVANIIDTFAYVMEIIDIVNSDTSTSSYYHMFADFTDNSGNNCRPVDMEYNNPETDDPNHIFEVTELDPVTGLESTTKKTIWEMNEQSKQDWEYDHATQTSWMRYFADDMFSYNIFSGIAVGENLDAIAATIQQEERENYNREFATWAANCIKQYNDFYTKYQEWLNDYDNLKSQQKIAENKLKEIGTEPAPETEFNFNTDDPKYQWYKNLWYRMGGLTETTKSTVNKCKELDSNLMNNAEWIQFALEHGVITLEQVSFNEKGSITYPKMGTYDWTSIEYGNAADISTTQNEIAIAKAETKYKNALNEIEIEDKKYDSDLKRLETEHTALQTEYDSLKSVIDKNIERSFKAFS